jgi:hypothetical protein
MNKSEFELFVECITDWKWWLDGIVFMLFLAEIFIYFIIFAA